MNKRRIFVLSAILAAAILAPEVARAQPALPGPCTDGTLPSGAGERSASRSTGGTDSWSCSPTVTSRSTHPSISTI